MALGSTEMARVVRQYLATAVSSSTDDDGNELSALFDGNDLNVFNGSTILEATLIVTDFVRGCEAERPDVFDHWNDYGQVGHDFWLTRNGHGAGFWDRGLGELGTWLTAMSKPYGEAYVHDDEGRVGIVE